MMTELVTKESRNVCALLDFGSEELAELIALNERRAAMYGMLSRLYRVEVDQEALSDLRERAYPSSTGNEDLDRGYRLIASYLGASGEDEATLLELAVDYVRVFFGHGVDTYAAAYPFESVYTSERRLLMQEARDEVLAVYRSEGLGKGESWKEGEDHIALELEFMQILAARAGQALAKGRMGEAAELFCTQRGFLEEHLASWVGMLTLDMAKFAKTGLYQGLACLTDGFIEVDQAFLNDVLTPGACGEAAEVAGAVAKAGVQGV